MSTPVCVPFRGCPLLGPRPGAGHKRRTRPRHLTGWKTKHPAPPQLVEPDHCMMTFGAALSAFVSAPPSGPPHHPACEAGACLSNPRLQRTSASTCRGKRPVSISEQPAEPLFCSQLLVLFSSCWRVQPFSFVSLLFSPACLHPSLFSAPFETSLLLNSDSVLTVPESRLGAENEGCCQKVWVFLKETGEVM